MVRNNIIANFVGRVWPSLLGLALVPVYLHYLGIEAYGLVGFFVSLQALIGFLDLGLSTTTNREVAYGLSSAGQKEKTRDLMRTLEVVYGLVALLIAAGFILSSDWLAREWINEQELSVETVRLAAMIFGITLALRWPVALYNGILLGSEKQVLYNILSVVVTTLRSVGAAVVVVFVSHTIVAYLVWQLISALLELGVMALAGWRVIRVDSDHAPRIKISLLKPIWRFSASVGLNSLFAAITKQMDRVLISKLLLLSQMGYYTTANAAYSAVSMVTSPFASVAFPRFTALIASNEHDELVATYHKMCQCVSFIVMPITSILLFFSFDILLLWTGSEDIAVHSAQTLSILAIAAIFNSMMQIPFMLQLAAGITWISLWNNAINLVVLAPLMYFLIKHYGVAGAGIAWLIFNVSYYLIVPHIMHRYVLPSEKKVWYFTDTLLFIVLSLATFGITYLVQSFVQGLLFLFINITVGCLIYLVLSMVFSPTIRWAVLDLAKKAPFLKRFLQKQVSVG
ncbi:MAG: polysaccharide biosynthesis protein [Anaerolineales bacterium]|nr:polysaccharide biosynthesis protein [Anaerolineales bacterium]